MTEIRMSYGSDDSATEQCDDPCPSRLSLSERKVVTRPRRTAEPCSREGRTDAGHATTDDGDVDAN